MSKQGYWRSTNESKLRTYQFKILFITNGCKITKHTYQMSSDWLLVRLRLHPALLVVLEVRLASLSGEEKEGTSSEEDMK